MALRAVCYCRARTVTSAACSVTVSVNANHPNVNVPLLVLASAGSGSSTRTAMKQDARKLSVSDSLLLKQNVQPNATPTVANTAKQKSVKSRSQKMKCDMIGPPAKDSNLRPIKFYLPANESAAEKHFRELRQSTQQWNQEFWSQHNRKFVKEKEAFIEAKLKELRRQNPEEADRRLTAEELSKFYKQFLDNNYKHHRDYNREWYRRNIGMLWPAIRVSFEKIFQRDR